MNPKMLFLILGVVAVGAGIFAIKNLQTKIDTGEEVVSTQTPEGSDDSNSDTGSKSRVAAIDANGSRLSKRSLADRTMRRGSGAASLDVTPATTGSASAAAVAQTPRIAQDTLEENRSIADLTNMFKSQTDPDARIDIAEKLGLIDSPESIKSVLELLRDEKDPAVQEALIEAMQGLESQEKMADEIFRGVSDIYMKTDNEDVKVAAQDLMGDLATPDAAAGLRAVVAPAAGGQASTVQVNAAENLLRISQANAEIVTPHESAVLSAGLKDQYTKGADAGARQEALMALATEGKANADFFTEALKTEQDPKNRENLQRLVRMFTGPAPATPPAGTVVTPAPTPF
jgi:hypothetical protein